MNAPKFQLDTQGVCEHCGLPDWSGFSCCEACSEALAAEVDLWDSRDEVLYPAWMTNGEEAI